MDDWTEARLVLLGAALLGPPLFLATAVGAFRFAFGDHVTAASAEETAAERARAWNADARLVEVSTFEHRFDDPWIRGLNVLRGERATDGRADLWFFRYGAPGAEDLFEVQVKGGDAVEEVGTTIPVSQGDPVGSWSVDSDAAVEKALAASGDLRSVIERSSFELHLELTRPDDSPDPTWVIEAGEDTIMGEPETVKVDATDGEIRGTR